MKRRLIAVLASLVLLLTFAPAASASYWAIHTSSCQGYMVYNSACFKENGGGGGDIILLIQGSPTYIDNLKNVATPSGTSCQGALFAGGSYNDCLTWVSYNIGSGYKLCVFRDAGHGSLTWSVGGPASGSRNLPENDTTTSIYLVPQTWAYC